MEEVDGYIIVDDYHEAIAAEIAFSKKIRNKGYEIVQIGKDKINSIFADLFCSTAIGTSQYKDNLIVRCWQ